MALIIPVFLVHRGCPHQCLFCNQHAIAGQTGQSGGQVIDVDGIIRSWLARSPGRRRVEVAFYGGSFTCLDQGEQERLLGAVQPYLATGAVQSIRLSTRPDCVSGENCRFLRRMGVTTVELGVQSLDDRVLATARRGHTAEQSRRAMQMLRGAGLAVGVQLLPGLPGESTRSFLAGVREVAAFGPALVRIYPVVVVEHSPLAEMYRCNCYRPLTLGKAVALTRRAREIFLAAGVAVARMGLQPSTALSEQVVAGPYHPAFGELVVSRQWFRDIRYYLRTCREDQHLCMYISRRDQSAVVGMKRMNMTRLAALGYARRFTIIPEKHRERGSVRYAVCQSS